MDEDVATNGATAEVPDAVPNEELDISAVAALCKMKIGQVYAAIRRQDLAKVPGRRPTRVMLSEAMRFKNNPPRRGRKVQIQGSDSTVSAAESSNGHP